MVRGFLEMETEVADVQGIVLGSARWQDGEEHVENSVLESFYVMDTAKRGGGAGGAGWCWRPSLPSLTHSHSLTLSHFTHDEVPRFLESHPTTHTTYLAPPPCRAGVQGPSGGARCSVYMHEVHTCVRRCRCGPRALSTLLSICLPLARCLSRSTGIIVYLWGGV